MSSAEPDAVRDPAVRPARRIPGGRVGIAVVVVAVVAAASVWIAAAASGPSTAMPAQFLAKAYTELLGRAPTPAEWAAGTAFFDRRHCSEASVGAFLDGVVGSGEYAADYPISDPSGRALSLYRGALDREPSGPEFLSLRDRLARGETATAALAGLTATPEFSGLVSGQICNSAVTTYYYGRPGHPGEFPAISTPTAGRDVAMASGAALQAELDARSAAGGGVVPLPAHEAVGLASTLTVPGNVTLETVGAPTTHRYADMAELARLRSFAGGQLVLVLPGGSLRSVWVDGQRDAPDPNHFANFDLRTMGGTGTQIVDDRIGNPDGASDFEADTSGIGITGALACRGELIQDNLFEAYDSAHVPLPGSPANDHPEADGLGVYCEDATISGNDFVDISDAAVSLFSGDDFNPHPAAQLSTVTGNTILAAGNSLYWGIVTDPGYRVGVDHRPGGDPAGTTSHAYAAGGRSTTISDNLIWTGPATHVDIALASGTHTLFGSVQHQDCLLLDEAQQAACGGGRNALGATWSGNSSGGQPLTAEIGIYVGGTDDATFRGNDLSGYRPAHGGPCPTARVLVDSGSGPSSDYADGLSIDMPFTVDRTGASDICVTPVF